MIHRTAPSSKYYVLNYIKQKFHLGSSKNLASDIKRIQTNELTSISPEIIRKTYFSNDSRKNRNFLIRLKLRAKLAEDSLIEEDE